MDFWKQSWQQATKHAHEAAEKAKKLALDASNNAQDEQQAFEEVQVIEAIDGQLYPKEFVRKENDVSVAQYRAWNIAHELSVDQIVDERVTMKGTIEYKVKFLGFELDEDDWYDEKNFLNTTILEKWLNNDKQIMLRVRNRGMGKKQKQEIPQVLKASDARVLHPRLLDTTNLDKLASICAMNEEEQKRLQRKQDDPVQLLNEMVEASNGHAYPRSWLFTQGDVPYEVYKDCEYDEDFEVERVVDSYHIEGQDVFLIKFIGYEVCFHDVLFEKDLQDCQEVLKKWKREGRSLLKRLRQVYQKLKQKQ
eukprot:TRINITY_DN16016_c0_g2_i1.p1 TRINITY_DN16016_c0_g2~~TRINITY_DN16016_c0_g2_i1.p1  ORF type:complete len:307 (+),score=51.50 TRINITY_DN16016_c0_g2_i1:49-969(+)